MFEQLVAKLNRIVKFVLNSDGPRHPCPQLYFRELHGLEREAYQLCHRAGLAPPACEPPDGLHATEYLGIPWRFATEDENAAMRAELMSLRPKTPLHPDEKHGVVLGIHQPWLDEMHRLQVRATALGSNEGVPAAPTTPIKAPVKYVFSWAEILNALDLKNNEVNRNRVKTASEQFGGPIRLPAQGGQPKANKAKLIEWWNHLEALWETQINPEGVRETTQGRHSYGKHGEVIPEISGAVKKRRRRAN